MYKNIFALSLIAFAVVVASDYFPGLLHDLAEVCHFDAVRRIIG